LQGKLVIPITNYVHDERDTIKSIAKPSKSKLSCTVNTPLAPAFVAIGAEVVEDGVGLPLVFDGLAAAALLLALAWILEARLESVGNASTLFVARQERVVEVVVMV
jgi:hypothetical protein